MSRVEAELSVDTDDELLRDSSISANMLTESPTERINGPSTKICLPMELLSAIWLTVTPATTTDMSNCLNKVPLLKSIPRECTIMGSEPENVIFKGDDPTSACKSCSAVSDTIRRAEVGTPDT